MANPATVLVASATVTVNTGLFARVFVGWDSPVLSLVVVKHHEWEIPGVTDDAFLAQNKRRRSGHSSNLGGRIM
jgi:hypothetical protein